MSTSNDGKVQQLAQLGGIEGVRVLELARHEDDRGYLFEIIHASDEFLARFGQVYVVCSPVRGTIRAFHKHYRLWDYFCVVRGAAKFVLARLDDDAVRACLRDGQTCRPEVLEAHVLTERKPSLLVVPAGTWHGWMALEDNTLVVATGSEVYNRESPDEIRVPPDVFGDVWTVRGR